MGQGLFFLLAGLALAMHSQPVRVGPLSIAPPELHCQQVLPPHQQEFQHNNSFWHHCTQTFISNTLKSQHVRRHMLHFGKVACKVPCGSCSAVPTCVRLYLPGDGPAQFCRGHLQEAGRGRATLGSPVHLGKARSPQLHDALVGHNHHLVLHTPAQSSNSHHGIYACLCLASCVSAEHAYSRSMPSYNALKHCTQGAKCDNINVASDNLAFHTSFGSAQCHAAAKVEPQSASRTAEGSRLAAANAPHRRPCGSGCACPCGGAPPHLHPVSSSALYLLHPCLQKHIYKLREAEWVATSTGL